MRRLRWVLMLMAVVLWRGCSCSQDLTYGGPDTDGGNPDALAGGGLIIMPAEVTLDVTPGGAAVTQAYTARTADGGYVSDAASWSIDDATLGGFTGRTLSAAQDHGGTTRVRASWQGLSGFATVHVRLHATVTDTCPGCPPFPPDTTPACAPGNPQPQLVYPPNRALLPPNMNVIQVQFDQASGYTFFEVDFANSITDVRVLTQCNPITDTHGQGTSGCAYDLDQRVWDYLARNNRGGAPVSVTVRATDGAASCVAASASRSILFGAEDLNGGIYYWQSVALQGVQGKTGGIFRYDFGKRGGTSEAFLSPAANVTTCVGCHFLSRDGQKMTYGGDDADADDEFGDLHGSLIDVATRTVSAPKGLPPGFQTFSPDHGLILASDGQGKNRQAAFLLFDGNTGAAASPKTVPTGGMRGTQPDWSRIGDSIVYVQPGTFLAPGGDDSHFNGGGLYTMSFDANAMTFGAPAPLLPSQGENNYYPAYSPDGSYVIFNRAPAGGTPLSQDAFANLNARVLLLPARGGQGPVPIDLPGLNDAGALTNSWPRWSPAVQQYKGHRLAWVTFSSTRDYGYRVRNSVQVNGADQVNCYPAESPQNPNGSKTQPLGPNCHQPQLWMAAIDLSAADAGSGDPSYPAFWLPFQDVTTHNHIAQWVTTIVGPGPSPDGGSCVIQGDPCTVGGTGCCIGVCIGGICTIP